MGVVSVEALLWTIGSLAGVVACVLRLVAAARRLLGSIHVSPAPLPRGRERIGAVYAHRAAPVLLALALIATLPGAAGAAAPGQVVVSFAIAPRFTSTFADGSVTVKSNAPWQVTADVPGGGRFVVVGGPTSGQKVDLPEGASGVAVLGQ